jgi:hypothetical protein
VTMGYSSRVSLVKKLSVVKTVRRLRELIMAYVDEVTKDEISHGFTSTAFAVLSELPTDKRYRCYGFVRAAADRASQTGEPELAALADWWDIQTAGLEKKAYHHAYSLKPEFAEELTKAGLPVADVLFDAVSRTYAGFADQFFGGDELGFIAGLHREKAHPHVHVLVFPMTRKGRQLNFSRLAPVRLDGREVRMDFQGWLQERFVREIDRYRDFLADRLPESPLLAERLIESGIVMGAIPPAEQRPAGKTFNTIVAETVITVEKSRDIAAWLIEQRKGDLGRLREERTNVIGKGGLPTLAKAIQQRAQDLRKDFIKANFDRTAADALSLRAARLTARLLELVAGANGAVPKHLTKPINTAAVRTGGLNRQPTAREATELLKTERIRHQELTRAVPLTQLANRELARRYDGVSQAEPAHQAVEVSRSPNQPALDETASVDIKLTGDEVTIEIRRRADELEAAGAGHEVPSRSY